MSRVDRKKLEKEVKKNKKTRLFRSKKKDVEEQLKIKEVDAIDKLINDKKNNQKNPIASQTDNFKKSKIENTLSDKTESINNIGSYAFTNEEDIENDLNVMKTADKIISVEDNELLLQRKMSSYKNGFSQDRGQAITVDDIITEEEISLGKNKKIPVKDRENIQGLDDKDANINDIKHLEIEKASFDDIVRVAESRIIAEKIKSEEEKKEEEKKLRQEQIKKDLIEKEIKEREKVKTQQLNLGNLGTKTLDGKNTSKEIGRSKKTMDEINKDEKNNDLVSKPGQGQIFQEDAELPIESGGFKKIAKKIGIFILVLIGIIYIVGCFIFKDRYFINTRINGIQADFKTASDLDGLASDKLIGYKLYISGRNGVKDSISGKDIDISYTNDDSSYKIKKEQGFFAWPLGLIKNDKIDGKLNISYNQEKLNNIVKKLNIFDNKYIKEPVSAFPKYDKKKGDYVVDKGYLGSRPIERSVIDFVGKSLKSELTNIRYPGYIYKEQNNKPDDERIASAIAKLKEYDKVKIVYDFEKEKYPVGTEDISKMFDIASEKDYSVTLSKDKIREFVRGLSKKYSTYGDPREIQSASTGGKLKVTGGIYGWLIDREKETDYLYNLLKSKKSEKNRKPIYAQTAISRENNDMGNEFIEIDLTKQHMWFVRNGEVVVDTPIVSGNPNKGDATPPGIYPITYKTRHATLKGPGYSSPVSYWMPFNSDIGIHDASWQPVYGGSRYLYAGSHGCINTPFTKVSQFYALAKEGMPVVVHY